MKKYLVTFEFRYTDIIDEVDWSQNKVITIGLYDTYDEACKEGNRVLPLLEERYPLNKHYNRKERFNKDTYLISNLAYLTTSFDFYGEIKTMDYTGIYNMLDIVDNAVIKYKEFKLAENN